MTTSALTLLFALILYVSYDIWKYEEQIKNQLEITAQIIGENNSAAILFEDKIAAKMSIKSFKHIDLNFIPCIHSVYPKFYVKN